MQVFAYELRMAALGGPALAQHAASREGAELATHEEVEGFYAQLEDTLLCRTGFLDPGASEEADAAHAAAVRARRHSRTRRVNILRGILKALSHPRRIVD